MTPAPLQLPIPRPTHRFELPFDPLIIPKLLRCSSVRLLTPSTDASSVRPTCSATPFVIHSRPLYSS